MTANKRRIAACLKACEGISTKNLEDNVPVLELARRYNAVLRERDALRAKIEAERQKCIEAAWDYIFANADAPMADGCADAIRDALAATPEAKP